MRGGLRVGAAEISFQRFPSPQGIDFFRHIDEPRVFGIPEWHHAVGVVLVLAVHIIGKNLLDSIGHVGHGEGPVLVLCVLGH